MKRGDAPFACPDMEAVEMQLEKMTAYWWISAEY
jgi:hypothetical protein